MLLVIPRCSTLYQTYGYLPISFSLYFSKKDLRIFRCEWAKWCRCSFYQRY